MTETSISPPLPPEGHDVDQSTRDFIDAALQPITAAVNELKTAVENRRAERETEHAKHTQERTETANDIAAIREYVETVKAQRDKEITERPTVEAVKSMIADASADASSTIQHSVSAALEPFVNLQRIVDELNGAVKIRLSDKDATTERLEEHIDALTTRMGAIERQAVQHFEFITDLRRALFGDASVKDGQPTVFGEIRAIGTLMAERDEMWRQKLASDGALTDTRFEAFERRMTVIEAYIQRQIDAENARAERRRRLKETAVKFIGKSPLWFKLGGILITGGGAIALLWEIVSSTFGL